ncbi:hypothetical protein BKA64DRAFT_706308 [Cadophora sp. MPI-SDFR-AT-0126]|nr:hypothetical protein BKA64DRAFT_706308 [Leotiomycetes sp. MPI-SDFR-AT-0126]
MENQFFTTLSAGGMQPASRSPSESLSDNSVQPESSPASSISAPTHDTSRTKYHINELSTFAQRLEEAATKIFPNKGRSRYKDVQVLLLRWEQDTMGVQYELDDLAAAFAESYGFKTETWLIPSAQPHLALMGKAFKMVQDFGTKDNLLIVYYAGHGGMNSSRQPLWTCTGEPSSPYLQWYAIQTIFEQAEADVLLLLDCCAAASSAPADGQCNSVTETIAACGFETWAPQPGRHSFTNTLIAVLDDWRDRSSFTAAMLHCEILNRLRHEKPERRRNIKNFECRRTPVHILSTIDARAGSVEICCRSNPEHVTEIPTGEGKESNQEPIDTESAMDIDSTGPGSSKEQPVDLYTPNFVNTILKTGETALPHVLISMALEEEQLLDLEQCRKWLQQFPALAKIAKVEGVYRSNSTLMILSLPVPVWDWLPDDMACSFIGYVHSSNVLSQEHHKPEPVPAAIPDIKTTLEDVDKKATSDVSSWTKISREFVDPRALEAGNELFEASSKSVVVFRALNHDEVQSYVKVTRQIRAAAQEVDRSEARARRTRVENIRNSLEKSFIGLEKSYSKPYMSNPGSSPSMLDIRSKLVKSRGD